MSAFIINYKTIDNILSIAENQEIKNQCCFLKSELIKLFGQNKYIKAQNGQAKRI